MRTAVIVASVPEETKRTISADGLGEEDLALGRGAEGRPEARRVGDRCDDVGVRVSED
jgi:hypothetical protein